MNDYDPKTYNCKGCFARISWIGSAYCDTCRIEMAMEKQRQTMIETAERQQYAAQIQQNQQYQQYNNSEYDIVQNDIIPVLDLNRPHTLPQFLEREKRRAFAARFGAFSYNREVIFWTEQEYLDYLAESEREIAKMHTKAISVPSANGKVEGKKAYVQSKSHVEMDWTVVGGIIIFLFMVFISVIVPGWIILSVFVYDKWLFLQ